MEKIIVNALEVRCLGNVVDNKGVDGLHEYLSNISATTDTIDGATVDVYTSEYMVGSSLTVEYLGLISPSETGFSVKATLKDNSNSVVSGATVYLDVNGTVMSGTTDSNGVVTFSVDADGSDKYVFTAYYLGTNSLGGCMVYGVVYSADADSFEMWATDTVIQTGDTCHFIGVVSGDGKGLPRQTVFFYEEYTPVLKVSSNKSILQTGDTADLSARVVDSDDGSVIAEQGVTVLFYKE